MLFDSPVIDAGTRIATSLIYFIRGSLNKTVIPRVSVCCWSDLREKIWARHSQALLHRLAEWVEYNLVKRVLRAHFYIPTRGGRRSRKLHTLPNKPITLQFKTHSRAFVDWVLLLRELRIRINKRLLCDWRKCKDVSSRRRCQDTWARCVRVPDDDCKS